MSRRTSILSTAKLAFTKIFVCAPIRCSEHLQQRQECAINILSKPPSFMSLCYVRYTLKSTHRMKFISFHRSSHYLSLVCKSRKFLVSERKVLRFLELECVRALLLLLFSFCIFIGKLFSVTQFLQFVVVVIIEDCQ